MPSDTFECIGGAEETPVCVRYFGISLYTAEYPHLCVYLPGDEAAYQAFPVWNLDNGIALPYALPKVYDSLQNQ